MTCGFVQTGRFEPILAVEIEPAAAEIYRANFGDHVHEGDIAEVHSFPAADVIIGAPSSGGPEYRRLLGHWRPTPLP